MPRAGECHEALDYPGKHILIGEKLEVLILWLIMDHGAVLYLMPSAVPRANETFSH